jgi:uncharacterized membrane protein YfcA
MLGLGGGVIFNPMLLDFGVLPMVASATGMYMVMFASATNTALYMRDTTLRYDWAIWMSIYTLSASLIGLIIVNKLVK